VEPGNLALQKRIIIIEDKLKKGEPTIPVMLADEINENPFLRPDSIGIRSKLGMIDAQDAAVFGELRKRKDRF
jgi:hydroxyacylglutathione hydrolase